MTLLQFTIKRVTQCGLHGNNLWHCLRNYPLSRTPKEITKQWKGKMPCISFINLLVFTTMAFIFCSYFHLILRFWCFALFHRLLVYITSDGLFSSFDVAELLKSLSVAIRREKHFISIYCRSTSHTTHDPYSIYSLWLSTLVRWFELAALCSKKLSVLFVSLVNRNSLSV